VLKFKRAEFRKCFPSFS